MSQEAFVPGAQFGLGDTVQRLFSSPKELTAGAWTWDLGPVFLLPTGTDELLGSEKWGAGPTGVALKQTGHPADCWHCALEQTIRINTGEGVMQTMTRLAGIALLFLGLPVLAQENAPGQHPKHWGYEGEVGPSHWQEFGSDFGMCSTGKNQSPVDLDNFVEAVLPPLAFDYEAGGHQVVNNGHAIQVNYNAGSRITVDGTDFELKQFHFHSPSENMIKARAFPMEAHFVHVDAKGNLAVVALMFEEGAANPLLERVWPHVPKVENGKAGLAPQVQAAELLHRDRDYYRYSGSLTTPPCSEGVRWFVLKHPATASAAQLAVVREALGEPNNRPVQPVGSRVILR